MARMPGAIWKPLAADWNKQPRMRAYDFFCIHTMVGSLDGTDGFFKVGNGTGYGGTESHFGTGPDGTIYQWQDTDFQADANGNGNWHVISSENADTGAPFPKWAGSDVPPLTPQQVEANARIAVWLYRTHGIPLGIAGNSKPGARGLAVHRYGVPGYMPAGAEQWSTSQGKACPGDRRIAQLPAISARAQQLLGGAATEDDMPTAKEVVDELLTRDLYYRYRDDKDPRGYGEGSAKIGDLLVDVYTQMFWGHGRNSDWGPGVARQLQALLGKAPVAGGASLDAAKLLADVGTVVRDALGADNATQADEIVDLLAARLGKPA